MWPTDMFNCTSLPFKFLVQKKLWVGDSKDHWKPIPNWSCGCSKKWINNPPWIPVQGDCRFWVWTSSLTRKLHEAKVCVLFTFVSSRPSSMSGTEEALRKYLLNSFILTSQPWPGRVHISWLFKENHYFHEQRERKSKWGFQQIPQCKVSDLLF